MITPKITPEEFRLFRDFIEKHCGIHLGPDKSYLVEHRLAGLLALTDCNSYGALFSLAKGENGCGEICTRIIDAITTNETSWFRDPKQFDALRRHLLPELWANVRAGKKPYIDIWSAACSTGQEPYTIAMTVLDFCEKDARARTCRQQVKILATDISQTSLTIAEQGVYDTQAINRGLEANHIARFFKANGQMWTINPELRLMVDFKRLNLRCNFSGIGLFDIIYLRNVIIYFSDAFKKELFARLTQCLRPGGRLFLGTGETIMGYCNEFEIEECRGATFYRLK